MSYKRTALVSSLLYMGFAAEVLEISSKEYETRVTSSRTKGWARLSSNNSADAVVNRLQPDWWYNPATEYASKYSEDDARVSDKPYATFDEEEEEMLVFSQGSDSYGPRFVTTNVPPFRVSFTVYRNETCDDHYVTLTKNRSGTHYTHQALHGIRGNWNCRFVQLFVENEDIYHQMSEECLSIPMHHAMQLTVTSSDAALLHEECNVSMELPHTMGIGPFYAFVGADDDHGRGARFTLFNITGTPFLPFSCAFFE
ncbi:hypothetical protein CYMTET_3686 [Cymbomonas tetramitiformis]|uniref:Uncharacterized protein n=1 Tax=Cymbomonas tetramitiformis TaxID=36881 RepID=A0AAE0H2P8_9CHLO|nr:hypothetical protein CYMTET_3686 [Cymbomonas tetramitiformis]|eukprot:gene997-1519_t